MRWHLLNYWSDKTTVTKLPLFSPKGMISKLPYGGSRFVFLIICRLISIIYCCFMIVLHQLLGDLKLTLYALELDKPCRTNFFFGILLVLHVIGLVRMFLRPVEEPTRWKFMQLFNKIFGARGLFGRKGHLYEYVLMLREVIEIPIQTMQARVMSHSVTDVRIPIIYGSVIVIDCILVPIIMNIKWADKISRRNSILVTDILVDITLGSIMPIIIILPSFLEYTTDPTIVLDLTWANNILSRAKFLMVTSTFDLIATLVPVFSSHFLMNSIHRNWTDIRNHASREVQISPQEMSKKSLIELKRDAHLFKWGPSHKRARVRRNRVEIIAGPEVPEKNLQLLERGLGVSGILWASILLYLMVNAPLWTSCNNDSILGEYCLLEVHPWSFGETSGQCHCLYYNFDCRTGGLSGLDSTATYNKISNALEKAVHRDLMTIKIRYCPIQKPPRVIEEYKKLNNLFLSSNDNLEEFDIRIDHMEGLFLLNIDGSALVHVPETLKAIPPSLYFLRISRSNISSLPEWISSAWQPIGSLQLYENRLDDFPSSLAELKNLYILEVHSNNIEVIPESISRLTELQIISFAYNNIQELPKSIASMNLIMIRLQKNNISSWDSLPWDKTTLLKWNSMEGSISFFFSLTDNPICNDISTEWKSSGICDEECAPLCDRQRISTGICNHECNNEACNFNNGVCLK